MGEGPGSANKKGPEVGLNSTGGGMSEERVGRGRGSGRETEERGFESVDAAEERGEESMGLVLVEA